MPSHTFTKEGAFTVKLFVTNASGCTDSLVKNAFIQLKVPVAAIKGLPQKGCAPLSHTFSSTITSLEAITGYHWDFGDGTSSDSTEPTDMYTTPGKYNITLTYTTGDGCVDSVQFPNGIIIGSKPGSNFTADPLNTCAYNKINFTDQTSGNRIMGLVFWGWFEFFYSESISSIR